MTWGRIKACSAGPGAVVKTPLTINMHSCTHLSI